MNATMNKIMLQKIEEMKNLFINLCTKEQLNKYPGNDDERILYLGDCAIQRVLKLIPETVGDVYYELREKLVSKYWGVNESDYQELVKEYSNKCIDEGDLTGYDFTSDEAINKVESFLDSCRADDAFVGFDDDKFMQFIQDVYDVTAVAFEGVQTGYPQQEAALPHIAAAEYDQIGVDFAEGNWSWNLLYSYFKMYGEDDVTLDTPINVNGHNYQVVYMSNDEIYLQSYNGDEYIVDRIESQDLIDNICRQIASVVFNVDDITDVRYPDYDKDEEPSADDDEIIAALEESYGDLSNIPVEQLIENLANEMVIKNHELVNDNYEESMRDDFEMLIAKVLQRAGYTEENSSEYVDSLWAEIAEQQDFWEYADQH